jgi:anti-sigma factor RsiW
MMKEISKGCERADELVSVLYGEATEREQRDFELHLKQCENCRVEFASFAQVREAIGEWRDEALTGFVSSPVVAAPPRKSAIAALRQFFDLSPLWMKGAVGFAVVVFCVLVVLALARLQPANEIPRVATGNPDLIYTQQDLDRAVQAAVTKHEPEPPAIVEPKKPPVAVRPEITIVRSQDVPKGRRPFSRAEREQLAAELRLLLASDESDLDIDR